MAVGVAGASLASATALYQLRLLGDGQAQSRPALPDGDRFRRCPDRMVRVSAGTFQMGSAPGKGTYDDERPQHAVTLSTYCIDETEVTAQEYGTCAAAGGCPRAPRTVNADEYSADDVSRKSQYCNDDKRPSHPINCVDWAQAAAYCEWAGKRLPTEAEWEYAARGTDDRIYPWGDERPSAKRLNDACERECDERLREQFSKMITLRPRRVDDCRPDCWKTTDPVGGFRGGASPFGALDMGGNVWEWTADWYDSYPEAPATNPLGPRAGRQRVYRGGGWSLGISGDVQTPLRSSAKPSYRFYRLGFRCARGD